MLKILHVANHVDEVIGGSIFATFQIAQCATLAGCTCDVATTIDPANNRASAFEGYFPSVRIHGFPFHFPKRNHASLPLFNWLSRHWDDYDIVHCHQIFHWPFIYCGLLAGRRRAPLVVSPHNSLDPLDLRKKAALKTYGYGPLVIRPTLAAARAILGTSAQEAREAVDYGARPAPVRRHLPLPVPMPPPANGSFRRTFQIADDALVVLFLSRLDRKKNVDRLIRAFAEVARERPEAILAIAGTGDGAVEGEGRRLCADLGIDDRVRWCGFLSGGDKSAAYVESDLFVLPSSYENFAMVVIEAMYLGLPVITTTGVHIHPELTAAGAARICDPEPASLGRALREMVADADLRSAYGERGRRYAEDSYRPEVVGGRYREFYESLDTPARRREDAVTTP